MARIKVYAGTSFNTEGEVVRTIVGTTSQKKAAELVGVPLNYIERNFRILEAHEEESKLGRSMPNVVLKASHQFLRDFKPEDRKDG